MIVMFSKVFALLLLFVSHASVADSRPSAELVKEYFALAKTKKFIEKTSKSTQKRVEQQTWDMLKLKLKGKEISPSQKAIMQKKLPEILSSLRAIFSWDAQEQHLLPYYVQGFSKEELEEVIAFLKTPAGKAYVEKEALVSERLELNFEKNAIAHTQKAIKEIDNLLAELKAEEAPVDNKKKNEIGTTSAK